jgi:hypothetical protein
LASTTYSTFDDNQVDVALGFNYNTIKLRNTENSTNTLTYHPFNATNATVLFLDWNYRGVFAVSAN